MSKNIYSFAEQLRQEGEHRGYEKGIHAGMQQGEYEAKLIVARNMLSNGFDHKTIKDLTDLNDQDLSKLAKTH